MRAGRLRRRAVNSDIEKSGLSVFIYASSEKNRMLACRFGEHRDNSRNSQSVFLVVFKRGHKRNGKK